jgi:hypothetical protein
MSTDPKAIVDKFLAENGFPFEMKVANIFQKYGLGIYQSFYYLDVGSGTWREIDVIGIWKRTYLGKGINIVFTIECKYASTPWVLFSSITEGFPICYSANRRTIEWMIHLSKQNDFDRFFELERNVGYGLTQTTTKEDTSKDNAFKAIQTQLNFLKSEWEYHRFSHGEDRTIYIPIIAIRGKLFEAKLDANGGVASREINEAQLFYKEDLFGVIPKIHIVTESILESYVSNLAADCNRLLITPYMNDVLIKKEVLVGF